MFMRQKQKKTALLIRTQSERRASWLEEMYLLTDHVNTKQRCLWDPVRSAWIRQRTQMTGVN